MKLHKKIIFILIILAITLSSGICNAKKAISENAANLIQIKQKLKNMENDKSLLTEINLKSLDEDIAKSIGIVKEKEWEDYLDRIQKLFAIYNDKQEQQDQDGIGLPRAVKVQSLYNKITYIEGKINSNKIDTVTEKTLTEVEESLGENYYIIDTGVYNKWSEILNKARGLKGLQVSTKIPNGGTHAVLGTTDPKAGHTIGEIIEEGKDFIGKANTSQTTLNGDNLQKASNTLYNILLTIGIFLAVAVGMYLGIKFMVASAEDKAKVKESLVPYIAGCVVIFGAFIIWKLAIMLLAKIA